MRHVVTTLTGFALLFLAVVGCQKNDSTDRTPAGPSGPSAMYETVKSLSAPVATKKPKALTTHGDTRVDNYYWLNERENPEVISYLEAENTYTDSVMAHLSDFQEDLFQEMKGRIKETDESVPYKDNGYYYLTRYEEGKEYPVYSRKKESLEAPEEIMLNINDLARGYSYYRVSGRSVSPDNKILAYGEDTLSRRIYTLRFKNLETGEMYEDMIPGTGGSAVWANDNKTIFYTQKDLTTLRQYKIMRHTLGTPVSGDVEVFEEGDETFRASVYKTKDDQFIVIGSYATLSQEYRYLDANTPNGNFALFQPRERGLEYSVSHFDGNWYIRTNMDAQNFRLMKTPDGSTTKGNWTEVIPHREDVLLEGMDIFQDYMVLSERKNGITQLRVRPWSGEEHYIEFGEDAYLAYTSTNPQFDTELLRLGYTSLTTPSSTFDYNMETKEFTLLKEQEVVGDFDKNNYQSERIMIKARDGVEVPVSIVYRRGFEKNGTHPLLLYGYGSYGASMDPSFRSTRLSLLDRGFVYAIAHIRGGEEMGRHWYEDGKLLNKKNTFFDFIDCGKALVAQGYAAEDKLFAQGGSAGGLLMGAVINYEPAMWKGVVAAVPFVDVVTTMLDESIPLTTGEFDEWGNPKDKEYYEYIKSYSPYDQVEAKDYPPLLVTTGLHDSQVQYWEPAKWVAKLREVKTDNNPLLLETNMDAGHGGASGRFTSLKETALEYAWLIDLAQAPKGI
jgi:oligopeptidase B